MDDSCLKPRFDTAGKSGEPESRAFAGHLLQFLSSTKCFPTIQIGSRIILLVFRPCNVNAMPLMWAPVHSVRTALRGGHLIWRSTRWLSRERFRVYSGEFVDPSVFDPRIHENHANPLSHEEPVNISGIDPLRSIDLRCRVRSTAYQNKCRSSQ